MITVHNARRTLASLAIAGAALITGCVSSANYNPTKTADSQFLEPQNIFKFSDIPVPMGFKPLVRGSYSFESDGVRVAVLKYRGRGNRDLVTGFFKEQMAIYKWNLLNMVEYGDTIMNFDKESETCIINLSVKGSSITVSISLGPKSNKNALKKNAADSYKKGYKDNDLLK